MDPNTSALSVYELRNLMVYICRWSAGRLLSEVDLNNLDKPILLAAMSDMLVDLRRDYDNNTEANLWQFIADFHREYRDPGLMPKWMNHNAFTPRDRFRHIPVYDQTPWSNAFGNSSSASSMVKREDAMAFHFQLAPLVANRLSQDARCRIMLFCASHDTPTSQLMRMEFPEDCYVLVNNQRLDWRPRGMKNKAGTFAPADVTHLCYLQAMGKNKVELRYTNGHKLFHSSLHLVQTVDVKTIIDTLIRNRFVPKETVHRQIRLHKQDDDLVEVSSTLSLKCPLSVQRIEVPSRSSKCKHFQCFDAFTFLSMNERTPRWVCPVCHMSMESWEELIVDGYYTDILRSTPKDLDSVNLNPNGSWERPSASGPVIPGRSTPALTDEPSASGSRSRGSDGGAIFIIDDDDDDDRNTQDGTEMELKWEVGQHTSRAMDPKLCEQSSSRRAPQDSYIMDLTRRSSVNVIDLTSDSEDEDSKGSVVVSLFTNNHGITIQGPDSHVVNSQVTDSQVSSSRQISGAQVDYDHVSSNNAENRHAEDSNNRAIIDTLLTAIRTVESEDTIMKDVAAGSRTPASVETVMGSVVASRPRPSTYVPFTTPVSQDHNARPYNNSSNSNVHPYCNKNDHHYCHHSKCPDDSQGGHFHSALPPSSPTPVPVMSTSSSFAASSSSSSSSSHPASDASSRQVNIDWNAYPFNVPSSRSDDYSDYAMEGSSTRQYVPMNMRPPGSNNYSGTTTSGYSRHAGMGTSTPLVGWTISTEPSRFTDEEMGGYSDPYIFVTNLLRSVPGDAEIVVVGPALLQQHSADGKEEHDDGHTAADDTDGLENKRTEAGDTGGLEGERTEAANLDVVLPAASLDGPVNECPEAYKTDVEEEKRGFPTITMKDNQRLMNISLQGGPDHYLLTINLINNEDQHLMTITF
ncbi:SUMO ligase siz1 [Mortierella sp. GBA35]|nr:SUMO ligase siz1 [Mortierella sp. GBA35]